MSKNTCDKELGDEIKFVNENKFINSLENIQKSLPFIDRSLCQIFKEKQFTGIVYSDVTQRSLTICYEIKCLWYTLDLLVNIRSINKETSK